MVGPIGPYKYVPEELQTSSEGTSWPLSLIVIGLLANNNKFRRNLLAPKPYC